MRKKKCYSRFDGDGGLAIYFWFDKFQFSETLFTKMVLSEFKFNIGFGNVYYLTMLFVFILVLC